MSNAKFRDREFCSFSYNVNKDHKIFEHPHEKKHNLRTRLLNTIYYMSTISVEDSDTVGVPKICR